MDRQVSTTPSHYERIARHSNQFCENSGKSSAVKEAETATKFCGMEEGGEHCQTQRCEFEVTDCVYQVLSKWDSR